MVDYASHLFCTFSAYIFYDNISITAFHGMDIIISGQVVYFSVTISCRRLKPNQQQWIEAKEKGNRKREWKLKNKQQL